MSLWGRNLTDTFYENALVSVSPFGAFYNDAEPRMYGVTLSYKFR